MNLKNKSILITGGCGFIGSHLIDRLIREEPERITVIDNLFLGKEENLADAKNSFNNLNVVIADAGDTILLKKLIINNNIDIVFDLAAMPLPNSLIDPRKVIENNNSIALNLLDMYKDDLFEELIHYSTSESCGSAKTVPMDENHHLDPMNPYGAGKAAIDMYIKTYNLLFGLKTKIIRPFNNYGPRQNRDAYAGVIPITIGRIFEGKTPILYGDGLQTRDYIFVKDTAEGTVRIAECNAAEGQLINLAAGREIQIKYIIETINNIMGFKGDIIKEPERVSDVRRHFASNKKLKDITGWVPQTSFEEGIKETIDWYNSVLSKKK
ncbi:GDP-mannose 4,6-dehydratase [Candidatus Woesearchaeota archaeon]|nr:GDP-mannose 4,6-dehydratase [Candidatus Woesearchaeota archaeon]